MESAAINMISAMPFHLYHHHDDDDDDNSDNSDDNNYSRQ